MADDDAPSPLDEHLRPPAEITPEVFAAHRRAAPGTANPERITNPVWLWLARHPEINAWRANRHFGAPTMGAGPGWTNNRFGQTSTPLPDGRTIAIAGEHEDYYDPDFYIYNDVQVTAPDGTIALYGYPVDVFPPTDFHTATLVGDHIYIIGNTGYRDDRRDRTQVLRLEVRSLAIEQLATTGPSPGWISMHTATLSPDGRTIAITGGRCEVEVDGSFELRDSVDDHTLDLATLTWTRTTDRRWTQYEVACTQGLGHLWEIRQLADYLERTDDFSVQQAAWYRERLPHEPDFAAWRARFQPPIPHEPIPRRPDDEWRVDRILVDGTTVRYTEASRGILLVIEGPLPASTITTLVEDLRTKLTLADHAEYIARCLT